MFNNSSKSALSRRLATLKIFSTVTVCSFLGGGVAVVYGGGVAVVYSSGVGTWLLDFAPGARLPEYAGLFSIVSSDKCQPGHSGFLIDNNNIAIIVRFHFHKINSNSIKIMVKYTVFNVNAVVKLKRDRHTCQHFKIKQK